LTSFILLAVIAVAFDLSEIWQPIVTTIFRSVRGLSSAYAVLVVLICVFYGRFSLNKPTAADTRVPRIRGFGPLLDLSLTAAAISSTFYSSLSVLGVVVLNPALLGFTLQDQLLVGGGIAILLYWSLAETSRMLRETFIISRTAEVVIK
jgi:hypothetical protein